MRREHLVDLDELVLRCQSPGARSGVAEAVACYRAGAFRSCIVATWMAVVWDYIDKLHALSAAGEGQATTILQKWEKARVDKDIRTLLDLEKTVPDEACSRFEMVSDFERADLMRLNEDRNRCAHPSFSEPGEIYQPSAETARAHLRNAVESLLEHGPTQGRPAIEKLCKQVESTDFPRNATDARRWLEDGPFARPRPILVLNFVKALAKAAILPEVFNDEDYLKRVLAAMTAVLEMQGKAVEDFARDQLPAILQGLAREQWLGAIALLSVWPDTWGAWPYDAQTRAKQFVLDTLPASMERVIPLALLCPPLQAPACSRAVQPDALINPGSSFVRWLRNQESLPMVLVEHGVRAYCNGRDFGHVMRLSHRYILPNASRLSAESVGEIIGAAATNQSVAESLNVKEVLESLREAKVLPVAEFDTLCRQKGLEKFVERWNLSASPQAQPTVLNDLGWDT